MTTSPRRTQHSTPTLRTPSRRATGGLLAGLAVTAAAAVVVLPGDAPEDRAPDAQAASVNAQTASRPSLVAAPPAARPAARPVRASRGGARTAPLPMKQVTRTVEVGPSFSGQASWYGGSFQGRRTANGERFDTHDYTAASKTLPFGTRLRVCHDGCVIVRVNDRGPYVGSRILDLSQAAARAIGYSGVAHVTATPVDTRTVSVVDKAALARRQAAERRALLVRRAAQARAAAEAQALAAQARADQEAAQAQQAELASASTSLEDAAVPVGLAAGLLLAASGGFLGARRRRTRSAAHS